MYWFNEPKKNFCERIPAKTVVMHSWTATILEWVTFGGVYAHDLTKDAGFSGRSWFKSCQLEFHDSERTLNIILVCRVPKNQIYLLGKLLISV